MRILHNYLNRKIIAIYLESLYRRFGKSDILAMCLIVGIQITRYTIVASTICTVRSDIYLNKRIIFHAKVLFSRHTDRSVCRQNHDTIVARTYANLILCTDHTQRLFATDLAFLDGKLLITIVEHCTHSCYDNFLTSSYVRRTTYDL